MDNAKQFHEDVMQLAGQIGELLDGYEYNEAINALVYMLAFGLVDASLSKEEAIQHVTKQLGELYDYISDSNPVQ